MSALSAGGLNLDLVREATSSSVYQHVPAPWSAQPPDHRQMTSDNVYHKPFPAVENHTPREEGHQTGREHRKHKKQSLAHHLLLKANGLDHTGPETEQNNNIGTHG